MPPERYALEGNISKILTVCTFFHWSLSICSGRLLIAVMESLGIFNSYSNMGNCRTVQVKFLKPDQIEGNVHSTYVCHCSCRKPSSIYFQNVCHVTLNFLQCLLRGLPHSGTREWERVMGGEGGQGGGIPGLLPILQPEWLCFEY